MYNPPMPKTLRYEQTFTILAPAQKILDFLFNPENHLHLHPLVKRIEVIERGTTADGHPFVVFDVTDALRMAGIPFQVKYRTKMIRYASENKLFLDAVSPGNVTTQVSWTMREQNGVTDLHEEVSLTAPSLLVNYSINQSKQSHVGMFARLKARMET
ncbi:MAG: hypothetical protein Fur0022_25930 [Anaerolineales bacterium]